MKASLTFFAYPNDIFDATVTLIPGVPVTSNGVTSYNARMILDAGDKTFYTGMTQNVNIILQEKDNVIVAPTTAIQSATGSTRKSGSGSADGSSKTRKYVNLVGSDGTTKRQNVQTGIDEGGMTEVISGLSIGDRIAEKAYSTNTSTGSSGIFGGLRLPTPPGGG